MAYMYVIPKGRRLYDVSWTQGGNSALLNHKSECIVSGSATFLSTATDKE